MPARQPIERKVRPASAERPAQKARPKVEAPAPPSSSETPAVKEPVETPPVETPPEEMPPEEMPPVETPPVEAPASDATSEAEALAAARAAEAEAVARAGELEAQAARMQASLDELEARASTAAEERDRARQRADEMELSRQEALKDYKSELLSLYEIKESLEGRCRELEQRLEQLGRTLEDRDKQLTRSKATIVELGQRRESLEAENRELLERVESADVARVHAEPLPQRLLPPVADLEYRLTGLFDSIRTLRKQLSLVDGDEATLEEYEADLGRGQPAHARPEAEPRRLPDAPPSPPGLVAPEVFDGQQAENAPTDPPSSLEVRSYRDIRSIGLDFGTTNSLLSYYKGVSIQGIFQISRGEREGYRELTLPSTLGYLERENRFVFGYEAEDIPARTLGYRKIRSIKRCLLCDGVDARGRCKNIRNVQNHDICGQGNNSWRLGRRRLETEEIIAEYLLEVLRRVERAYDVELTPEKINFTVPIYFGYVARKKYREAITLAFQRLRGRAAGDKIEERIKLVHEPTAAAISQYNQFREMPDEVFAIFDMGGGTTDVAVYEKRRDNLWCLAAGSVQVGGDDLDAQLLELIETRMKAWPVDRRKTESRRVLDDFLENLTGVREHLSVQPQFHKVFHFPEGDCELTIAQEELEEAVRPRLERAVDSLVKVYEEVQPILETFEKPLTSIYLVGGATKTPLVRRMLREAFARAAPSATGEEIRVQPVSKFVGISAPAEARQVLEEEFNIVSVAVGAGFPEANFREYLLDKVPFEIGVVIDRDANLDPLPVRELVPFYKACEPVPRRCSRRLKVSQSPGNRLNIYMKRDGDAFYKIISFLKFPVRVGDEVRYLSSDKLCDLSYEIALEVTKDVIQVDFDGVAQEQVAIPGTHPYYLQRDIKLEFVSRLSSVADFAARYGGKRKDVSGKRTQDYLRRNVKERDPVELVLGGEGRYIALHRGTPIGLLRAEYGSEQSLPEGTPFVRLLREDILLPDDLTQGVEVARHFRPGDQLIVFDIGFEGA